MSIKSLLTTNVAFNLNFFLWQFLVDTLRHTTFEESKSANIEALYKTPLFLYLGVSFFRMSY